MNLKDKLSPDVIDALLQVPWTMSRGLSRVNNATLDQETLLTYLDELASQYTFVEFLRSQESPRQLANTLLEAARIPTTIPAAAMRVLGLGDTERSPLDVPVFWDRTGVGHPEGLWRRCDRPIAAVQTKDGSWEQQSATY